MIGHEWKSSDIPHACGRVLDVKKISETKSQLICAFCKAEIAVWVTENPKKEQIRDIKNARFFNESTLERFK